MTTRTTFTWPDLTHSPWVDAVYRVLHDLPEPLDREIDVRDFVFPDRMPIRLLRDVLDFLQVPETSHLSDTFTRRVGENLYAYFQRNSWLAVDRTAADLQFEYIADWRHGDLDNPAVHATRRTALDFCITPSPLVEVNDRYLASVRDWLEWVLPYLEGEVRPTDNVIPGELRPRIAVQFCDYGELDLEMQIGADAIVIYDTIGVRV